MPASCTASPCHGRQIIEAHEQPNLLGGVVTLSAVARKEVFEELGQRPLPHRTAGG